MRSVTSYTGKLCQVNLMGRFPKCEFLKEKMDYPGFEVSSEGIYASSNKVKAFSDWPRPNPVHDVRSLLGTGSSLQIIHLGLAQAVKTLT